MSKENGTHERPPCPMCGGPAREFYSSLVQQTERTYFCSAKCARTFALFAVQRDIAIQLIQIVALQKPGKGQPLVLPDLRR